MYFNLYLLYSFPKYFYLFQGGGEVEMMRGEYVFNLVRCPVLFFAFLQPMICRLKFSASMKEKIGFAVIWLEYKTRKCAGIHLNLVYSNWTLAHKAAGFICNLLISEPTRATEKYCSSLSLIIFSLCLHDDSRCLVIWVHLSTVLISSRPLIQFPRGSVGFVQFHGYRLTLNCHLINGCYWSQKTDQGLWMNKGKSITTARMELKTQTHCGKLVSFSVLQRKIIDFYLCWYLRSIQHLEISPFIFTTSHGGRYFISFILRSKWGSMRLIVAEGKDDRFWTQIMLNLKSSFDNIYQCEVGKIT